VLQLSYKYIYLWENRKKLASSSTHLDRPTKIQTPQLNRNTSSVSNSPLDHILSQLKCL